MKKITAAITLSFLCSASAIAGDIKYEGSSTVGKFINDAKAVYTAANFKLRTKTESGGGEKCSAAGKCDIGGVARDVKQEVLDKGVVVTTVGKDAIAAIVHPSNPVGSLSLAQLSDIFSGKVSNWKAVGGPDLPIEVLITGSNSATNKVFKKVVLQGGDYKGKVVKPDAKIVKLVSSKKGAVGQISFAFIIGNNDVKAIKPDGQEATTANPNYPITRPLNLVTKDAPKGEVKKFIDWALSAEGSSVVQKRFVAINIGCKSLGIKPTYEEEGTKYNDSCRLVG